MHCHANARLTPRGRATVFELGRPRRPELAAPDEPPPGEPRPGGRHRRPPSTDRLESGPARRPGRAAGVDRPSRPSPPLTARPDAHPGRGPSVRAHSAGWPRPPRHEEARPDRRRPGPPGDRRSADAPARSGLGDPPRRDRRRDPARLRRAPARREEPHHRPLPRPGAALVPLAGDPGPAAPHRQRQSVPEPGGPGGRPPTRAEAFSDPPVPAPDERHVRAPDPDRPRRVPPPRGLRLLRRAPACARPLRPLRQRGTPSPWPRRTDASTAAQREARCLTA